MLLLIYWLYFIIFSSQFFNVLRLSHFLLFSYIMLMVTIICNENFKTNISFKTAILLLTIPYSIYWYIIIVYNKFLKIHPFSYEFVIYILFFLTYLIIYSFWES